VISFGTNSKAKVANAARLTRASSVARTRWTGHQLTIARTDRFVRSQAMKTMPTPGMASRMNETRSFRPPITLAWATALARAIARPRQATRSVVRMRGPVSAMIAALTPRIAIVKTTHPAITRRAQGRMRASFEK
jgi:hypothetical protein